MILAYCRVSPIACWCPVLAAEFFPRDLVDVEVLDGPRAALAGSRLVTVEDDADPTGIERVADLIEELLTEIRLQHPVRRDVGQELDQKSIPKPARQHFLKKVGGGLPRVAQDIEPQAWQARLVAILLTEQGQPPPGEVPREGPVPRQVGRPAHQILGQRPRRRHRIKDQGQRAELVDFILEAPLQRPITGHRVVVVEQPQVIPHPQQLTRRARNHFRDDPSVQRRLQESSAVGVVSGQSTQRKTNAVRFHTHLPIHGWPPRVRAQAAGGVLPGRMVVRALSCS